MEIARNKDLRKSKLQLRWSRWRCRIVDLRLSVSGHVVRGVCVSTVSILDMIFVVGTTNFVRLVKNVSQGVEPEHARNVGHRSVARQHVPNSLPEGFVGMVDDSADNDTGHPLATIPMADSLAVRGS